MDGAKKIEELKEGLRYVLEGMSNPASTGDVFFRCEKKSALLT